MSWWVSQRTGELIGDPVADRLGHGLQAAAAAFCAGAGRLPPLGELLGALAAALARVAPVALEGGSALEVRSVLARLEGGGQVRGRGADAPPSMAGPLADALLAVRDAYEEAHDRKPTLAEVMAVVDFVLGAAPDEYAADADTAIEGFDAVAEDG